MKPQLKNESIRCKAKVTRTPWRGAITHSVQCSNTAWKDGLCVSCYRIEKAKANKTAQPTPEQIAEWRKTAHAESLKRLAEIIKNASVLMQDYSKELDKLQARMLQEQDANYAGYAAQTIQNCFSNLRLDLLVKYAMEVGENTESEY